MAEAILTGEEIEKLPCEQGLRCFGFRYTIFPWLTKYFFMSDRPGNRSDRNRQQEEPGDLFGDGHHGRVISNSKPKVKQAVTISLILRTVSPAGIHCSTRVNR